MVLLFENGFSGWGQFLQSFCRSTREYVISLVLLQKLCKNCPHPEKLQFDFFQKSSTDQQGMFPLAVDTSWIHTYGKLGIIRQKTLNRLECQYVLCSKIGCINKSAVTVQTMINQRSRTLSVKNLFVFSNIKHCSTYPFVSLLWIRYRENAEVTSTQWEFFHLLKK